MPIYSISYDLHNSDQKRYDKLEEEIKKNSNGYLKYAETAWVVFASGSALNLRKNILPDPKPKDRILVIKVVNDHSGWMSESQWETLKSLFK